MGRLLLPLFLLASSFAQAQAPAAGLTPDQWRADLAYLAKELPARHIKAFAVISQADFEAKVKDLDARIPTLPEPSIRARILKLVASLGDAHTNAQVQAANAASPIVPLIFHWYKDGIYVIAATEPNKNLLGNQLLKVGKLPAEEACRSLGAYVPHENDAQLKEQAPGMLMRFDLLQEIGAAENAPAVRLELQSAAGQPQSAEVEPVVFKGRPQWIPAYTGEPPLYQQASNLPYSSEVVEDGKTLYFRYNNCINDVRKPFPKFAEELKNTLAVPSVNRLIIDLRNNAGGNSAILDPFIAWLKSSRFNKKGSLYVLIGRRTFSSAILNAVRLRNETAATLVGEPTGGKPNHFGEVKSFELPNSHIRVSYSTKSFQESKADTPSLMPDTLVETTSHDFLTGADPVLALIVQ